MHHGALQHVKLLRWNIGLWTAGLDSQRWWLSLCNRLGVCTLVEQLVLAGLTFDISVLHETIIFRIFSCEWEELHNTSPLLPQERACIDSIHVNSLQCETKMKQSESLSLPLTPNHSLAHSLALSLSLPPPLSFPLYSSIRLSISLTIYLPIYLPTCLSVFLSFYLSICTAT